MGCVSQVEGGFGGARQAPGSPPTCFEGSALSLILLDSILSGSKLKTSSNPKWEKSLLVVHLFKWIFIIKF